MSFERRMQAQIRKQMWLETEWRHFVDNDISWTLSSKWVTSRGHCQRVTSRGHFLCEFCGHFWVNSSGHFLMMMINSVNRRGWGGKANTVQCQVRLGWVRLGWVGLG